MILAMLKTPSSPLRKRLALIAVGLSLVLVALAATSITGTDVGGVLSGKGFNGWGPFASDERTDPSEASSPPAQVEGRINGEVPKSERVPGSFIVELAHGLDPSEVAPQVARDYGGEVAFLYDHVLGGFAFRGPDDARERLASDPRVHRVDEDVTIHVADTCAWSGGGNCRPELNAMRAPQAWDIEPSNPVFRGANAVVAILDTGLSSHPAFASNILRIDGSCSGDSGSGDPHGSRTFGTAVGDLGVLPLGKGIGIKIASGNTRGTTAALMTCGLNRVARLFDTGTTIHAANLSWESGGAIAGVQGAMQDVRARGILVTAAAGNTGGSVTFPARYAEAVAVAGTTTSNTSLWSFSARGSQIDLAAPATVTTIQGQFDGTSYSAPQVAAAAALVKSLSPGLTADQVLDILQKKGLCPPGATQNANLDGGMCNGANRNGDSDGIPEPALNVEGAALGTDPLPTGLFVTPTDNQDLSGLSSFLIKVNATDDDTARSALDVDLKIGSESGFPHQATFNATPSAGCPSGCHEFSWTLSGVPDGTIPIKAQITESGNGSTTIGPVNVKIDNVNTPPTVAFELPTNGANVGPTFSVRVAATDDRDSGGLPAGGVRLSVDGGAPQTLTLSAGKYIGTVAGPLSNGPHSLTATATDSASQPTSSTINVAVSDAIYRQDWSSSAGWKVSSTTGNLWHISSSCAPGAAYYGQEAGCNYNTGSSSGKFTSPTISGLPSSYTLAVDSKAQVESCSGCTLDRRRIQLNFLDGVGWRTVYDHHAGNDPGTGSFETLTFPLSSGTGQVKIRFYFRTGSSAANNFFGWAVDNVVLRN